MCVYIYIYIYIHLYIHTYMHRWMSGERASERTHGPSRANEGINPREPGKTVGRTPQGRGLSAKLENVGGRRGCPGRGRVGRARLAGASP